SRSRGTCANRLTIGRQELEQRVLVAVREGLMRPDLFKVFYEEYVRELNRLRMERRASLSQGKRDLAETERQIERLIQAITDGISAASIKEKLHSLEARRTKLKGEVEAPEMPHLLHPRMADMYREKVSALCQGLDAEDTRASAVEAIRSLIEAIVL